MITVKNFIGNAWILIEMLSAVYNSSFYHVLLTKTTTRATRSTTTTVTALAVAKNYQNHDSDDFSRKFWTF